MAHEERVEETQLTPKRRNVVLLVFWLPFVVAFFVDAQVRITATETSMPSFSVTKEAGRKPNAHRERLSGDLVRLANVPFVKDRFSNRVLIVTDTNSQGYRDTEVSLTTDPEVVLCGASFADHGSRNSKTMTAVLGREAQVVIRNRSFAGDGPVASIARYLTEPGVARPSTKVVVWCLLERLLKEKSMRELSFLDASLSPAENFRKAEDRKRKGRKRPYLPRLESYFVETSRSREFWLSYGSFILPTAFDRATDSFCALFELEDNEDRPMAFYRPTLVTHRKKFTKADMALFLPGILTVNTMARAINHELLLVLIPDKYTIYGSRAKPVLGELQLRDLLPTTGRLELVSGALKEAGIEFVNLTETFREAATSTRLEELLYYPEDTHWNDRGIELASGAVAKRLRWMLDRRR